MSWISTHIHRNQEENQLGEAGLFPPPLLQRGTPKGLPSAPFFNKDQRKYKDTKAAAAVVVRQQKRRFKEHQIDTGWDTQEDPLQLLLMVLLLLLHLLQVQQKPQR